MSAVGVGTLFSTPTSFCASGVPSIGTNALTGNDSGCSGILMTVDQPELAKRIDFETHFATSHMRPTRSSSVSPRPRIPPEQTLIPAPRTASIVANLSSNERVVITWTTHSVMVNLRTSNGNAHLRIKLSRRVQVVVVGRETRLFELTGLVWR